MEYYNYTEITGTPLRGRRLEQVKILLRNEGLDYDEGISYTYGLMNEQSEWIATGSLDGNVLKCIAVKAAFQGMGIMARILSHLSAYAHNRGITHLFLYTKPQNERMFGELGFYTIVRTEAVVLMENCRDGIGRYVESIRKETEQFQKSRGITGNAGAVVVNCNPFTLGHRYLIERAAAMCDLLHVFVVSSEKSFFGAADRLRLVKEGVEDIPNVIVHSTKDYLVSPATFPSYFLKEKTQVSRINCAVDIQVFALHIGSKLNITVRFAGTEPQCGVTRRYNEQMQSELKRYGITFCEIPRREWQGVPISASLVRRYIREEKWEAIAPIVPKSTYTYILEQYKHQ